MVSDPHLQIAFALLRGDPRIPAHELRARAEALAPLIVVATWAPEESDVCPGCWQGFSNGVRKPCQGNCVFAEERQ